MIPLHKIKILIWADLFGWVVSMGMMPYLTDVRKLHLAHAGAIMNLFDGLAAIIAMLMVFLVDAFTGDFIMLLLASISCSLGMLFLTTTIPGFLFAGNAQVVLFYVALLMIAIGKSGHKTSFDSFFSRQLLILAEEIDILFRCTPDGPIIVGVAAIVILVLYYVNSWSVRFGVSAIFIVIATLVFISGSCSYEPIPPQGRLRTRGRTIMQYVRLMPLLITFVIGGVISSISSSYFVEQANHLNYKFWFLKLNLPMLLAFFKGIKDLFGKVFNRCCRAEHRVVVAMLFATLGCITAALVEKKRLGVVESHGLIEKPGEQIPMSIFWLMPQFFLIAVFVGVLESASGEYMEDKVPGSEKRQAIFSEGVVEAGNICGAGLVYVLTKLSERGGRPSWFQQTLNQSRLDNYYWTLAALSAVTLVFYTVYQAVRVCLSRMGICEDESPYDDESTSDEEISIGVQVPVSNALVEVLSKQFGSQNFLFERLTAA